MIGIMRQAQIAHAKKHRLERLGLECQHRNCSVTRGSGWIWCDDCWQILHMPMLLPEFNYGKIGMVCS